MMTSTVPDTLSALQQLELLLSKGKLSLADHKKFTQAIQSLHASADEPIVKDTLARWRKQFPSIGSDSTMQGLAFVKKHGYAGDFEIIDKIYTEWKSSHPEMSTWDHYFHQQVAPLAVRNRKQYFKQTLHDLGASNDAARINILNLASGPCRDILEFFQESNDMRFHFTCVELDPNAIAYAAKLLGDYTSNVHFVPQNIFRFIPSGTFDLVWSAGLFDYFDDVTFVKILRRYQNYPRVCIGNFSDQNPTSGYMELIGEWYLNYRSPQRLVELAMEAGFSESFISVENEPAQVNLFLNIQA